MAKKQVIWSRSAKKDLYAALESYLIKCCDKKLTFLFFKKIERKIELFRRNKLEPKSTSSEGIYAFTEESYCVLFGETESNILIHNISEV